MVQAVERSLLSKYYTLQIYGFYLFYTSVIFFQKQNMGKLNLLYHLLFCTQRQIFE